MAVRDVPARHPGGPVGRLPHAVAAGALPGPVPGPVRIPVPAPVPEPPWPDPAAPDPAGATRTGRATRTNGAARRVVPAARRPWVLAGPAGPGDATAPAPVRRRALEWMAERPGAGAGHADPRARHTGLRVGLPTPRAPPAAAPGPSLLAVVAVELDTGRAGPPPRRAVRPRLGPGTAAPALPRPPAPAPAKARALRPAGGRAAVVALGRRLVVEPEHRTQLPQALLVDRLRVGEGEVQLVQHLHAQQPVEPDPAGQKDVEGGGR